MKAARSAPSFSAVVPARGYSSRDTTTGAPFFRGTSTGTISRSKTPDAIAVSARAWLPAANASWSARDTLKRFATSSAVIPMWQPLIEQVSPSCSMESTASALPMR